MTINMETTTLIDTCLAMVNAIIIMMINGASKQTIMHHKEAFFIKYWLEYTTK